VATAHQISGAFGETRVVKFCSCPHCKREKTLVRLPTNFKCADVICDFCGFLAQVKATSVKDVGRIPGRILGAAWGPQKERMDSAIYFPLYLVLKTAASESFSIFYLAADLQRPEMFLPRPPLSEKARRAGWQGFVYNLEGMRKFFVQLM